MSGNNVIPMQPYRDKRLPDREITPTTAPVDIRTSQLPARVVETDSGELRLYPAVTLDTPVDDQKASRSRKFKTEPIGVSAEMALFLLTSIYGPDAGASMIFRATAGEYVFGEQKEQDGGGYKWRIGWNIASDDSREPGFFILQCLGFRQHSRQPRKG